MADSAAIKAGRAAVELFLDDNPLTRGLARASAKLKAWGAGISAVGTRIGLAAAAITAPLLGTVTVFTEMASEIGRMATRTGISVEQLSLLAFAGRRAGVELEDLGNAIGHMQKNLFKIGGATPEVQQALGKLGVSLRDLKSQTPDQQFLSIAQALASVQDPGKRAAEATTIFGRGFGPLLPLLAKGRDGIEQLMEKGRELGVVLTGEDVQAARDFKNVMKDLKDIAMSVSIAIAKVLLPAMTRLREMVLPAARAIAALAKENAGLFDHLFDIATGAAVAGVALIVLGKAAALAGVLLGAVGSAVTFLLSPIGILTAVVGYLGYQFYATSQTGQEALTSLGAAWGNMSADALTAWGGIKDALASGDIVLALKIAASGLKSVWITLLAEMKIQFLGFIQYITPLLLRIGATLAGLAGVFAFINPAIGAVLAAFSAGALGLAYVGKKTVGSQEGIASQRDKDLEAQRAELAALTGEAAKKKPNLQGATISNSMQQAAASSAFGNAAGTFSGFGALALPGRGENLGDKIDHQTEEQKASTQRIVDQLVEMARNGFVFA